MPQSSPWFSYNYYYCVAYGCVRLLGEVGLCAWICTVNNVIVLGECQVSLVVVKMI